MSNEYQDWIKEEYNERLRYHTPEMYEALLECVKQLKLFAPNSNLFSVARAELVINKIEGLK